MNFPGDDLEHFRSLVSERLGLRLECCQQLGELLEQRAHDFAGDTLAYLRWLAGDQSQQEWRALARALTVAETYFFRHPEQLQAYAEAALPFRMTERSKEREVTVLSAGCASGEEPYSLIMAAHEARADFDHWNFQVVGVDLNAELLQRAERGRYSEWSLRATSPTRRARYFRKLGKEYELDHSIRARASFNELNLLHGHHPFWQPPRFDIIFCRNVIIYLEPQAAQQLVTNLTKVLLPGGFLFLGATESLRGYSNEYHLFHSHGAFYYRRRETGAPARRGAGGKSPAVLAEPAGPVPDAPAKSRGAGRAPAVADPPARGATLHLAMDLLRQEKFSAALDVLSAEEDGDGDVLLLRAAIMTNAGRTGEAEILCRQVLAGDELNPGAHYLLALCREQCGELEAAAEEHQTAIYLDPSFAMGHLHLGLLARRSGDFALAERALLRALLLLDQENPARILLFGGGFHRDGLAQLCRQALRRVRGER